MRRAARTDNNHADIRDGLRDAGYEVDDTHSLGDGFADIVVESKAMNSMFIHLEIKSLGGKLTPAETEYHELHKRAPLKIVYSLEGALLVMEQYDQIRFD